MKIQAINNNQNQYKSKINFGGKLILPENTSEKAGKFITENKEKLLVLAGKLPYDTYVRELPTKEQSGKLVLVFVKEGEVVKESMIERLTQEVNEQTDTFEKLKESLGIFLESIKYSEKPSIYVKKRKYYVPETIGRPQKPFIPKNKH